MHINTIQITKTCPSSTRVSWFGKYSHPNIFLYAAPAANNFFVSLSPCKHLFLLAYNLFQCLQPLQTIYFKIFRIFEQNYNCSFSSMRLFVHLLINRRHFLFFFLYLGCCVLFQLTFRNPVLYT